MFSRILMIFILHLLNPYESETAPAVTKARQFLPPLPGYVPVYIRPGDTPLEDINLDLAEAFSSYARKHARLSFGRSQNDVVITELEKKREEGQNLQSIDVSENKDDISIVGLDEDINLEEQNDVGQTSKKILLSNTKHIQKISRS